MLGYLALYFLSFAALIDRLPYGIAIAGASSFADDNGKSAEDKRVICVDFTTYHNFPQKGIEGDLRHVRETPAQQHEPLPSSEVMADAHPRRVRRTKETAAAGTKKSSEEGDPNYVDFGDYAEEEFEQFERSAIIGEIRMGTARNKNEPLQQFSVEFNTFTTGFWLVGSECKQELCKGTRLAQKSHYYTRSRFDKKRSTTFKESSPPQSYRAEGYGTGTAGVDRFYLGGGGGDGSESVADVGKMRVGVLTRLYESNDTFTSQLDKRPIDGIFGLGPTRTAGEEDGQPGAHYPLDSLLFGLAEASFTIWMKPLPSWWATGSGRITFGASDPHSCSEKWASTLSVNDGIDYWQVGPPTLRFGKVRLEKLAFGLQAEFAPQLPAITMPTVVFNAILAELKQLNFQVQRSNKFLIVEDCVVNKLPPLELSWSADGNGRVVRYSIPPEAYAIKGDGGEKKSRCTLVLAPVTSGVWLLGAPFYRAFCVKHNLETMTISMAERIDGEGAGKAKVEIVAKEGEGNESGGGSDGNSGLDGEGAAGKDGEGAGEKTSGGWGDKKNGCSWSLQGAASPWTSYAIISISAFITFYYS